MNALKQFARQERKYLLPYLTAGFPDEGMFVELAHAAADAGADALEIGVPFSDPAADGPTIQWTGQKALDAGIDSLEKVARLTSRVSALVSIPIVWMGYLNPFLKFGLDAAAALAADAGVDGLIIPDMPFEESDELRQSLDRSDIAWIPLLTSTTSAKRAQSMLNTAESFAYYVAIAGVTGARSSYPAGWNIPLGKIRSLSDRPIFVGFGVSSPELAWECASVSDGVIVGSALLQKVMDHPGDAVGSCSRFLGSLREALDA